MSEKIKLTPELAQELLGRNYPKNRKLSKSTVANYANDILDGRWNEEIAKVDQPLAISPPPERWLLNGQHRCAAVILANKSIKTYIEYDVPEELYKYFDGGRVRGAKDFLSMPDKTHAAALGKFICAIEDGVASLTSCVAGKLNTANNTTPTRTQIVNKTNKDPDYIQRLIRLGQKASSYLLNKRTPMSCALFIIDYVEKGDSIDSFVNELANPVPTSQPIIASRSYMITKMTDKRFKFTTQWFMGCIFMTYEYFIEDKNISSLNKSDAYFSKYDSLMKEERKIKND